MKAHPKPAETRADDYYNVGITLLSSLPVKIFHDFLLQYHQLSTKLSIYPFCFVLLFFPVIL